VELTIILHLVAINQSNYTPMMTYYYNVNYAEWHKLDWHQSINQSINYFV